MKESEFRKMMLSLICLSMLTAGFPAAYVYADDQAGSGQEKTVTLRVCNWEEYMDLGEWDQEETIDLDSGDIIGENPLYKDFEEWYYQEYGIKCKVEYSTFGTNEDLYNMLTLGDTYDLVCPSEYMIMKMISKYMLVPYSDDFFDESNPYNYYINGVSPYIRETFETNEINGEYWNKYAAGYMWGVTGIVYNPEIVTKEEAQSWSILSDSKFVRRVTVKDNVRDTFFSAVGDLKSDLLLSDAFLTDPDYRENLAAEMNDTSKENIETVQEYLQKVKDNVYSFETDSGKADMITGKVVANYQWSGDAVYCMDQAEEDDFILNFAVPKECTNLWFDGWVMLKNGIRDDQEKLKAAQAFVNFLSRPDNAIRNMYYIGYTSCISACEDGRIYEYLDWNYGAEDGEEDTIEYPIGYFFNGDNEDPDYVLTVSSEQADRQLGAQYPTLDVFERSAIMQYFDEEANASINQMWINVRCFSIYKVPAIAWILTAGLLCLAMFLLIRSKKRLQDIKKYDK